MSEAETRLEALQIALRLGEPGDTAHSTLQRAELILRWLRPSPAMIPEGPFAENCGINQANKFNCI